MADKKDKFDILGYRDAYQDHYGNAPLDYVAQDVYYRSGQDNDPRYKDYADWKKQVGIEKIVDNDAIHRQLVRKSEEKLGLSQDRPAQQPQAKPGLEDIPRKDPGGEAVYGGAKGKIIGGALGGTVGGVAGFEVGGPPVAMIGAGQGALLGSSIGETAGEIMGYKSATNPGERQIPLENIQGRNAQPQEQPVNIDQRVAGAIPQVGPYQQPQSVDTGGSETEQTPRDFGEEKSKKKKKLSDYFSR
jgi:hypothetical protein